jgi:hypothetical protein
VPQALLHGKPELHQALLGWRRWPAAVGQMANAPNSSVFVSYTGPLFRICGNALGVAESPYRSSCYPQVKPQAEPNHTAQRLVILKLEVTAEPTKVEEEFVKAGTRSYNQAFFELDGKCLP